jgi:hypothetical protein
MRQRQANMRFAYIVAARLFLAAPHDHDVNENKLFDAVSEYIADISVDTASAA